MSTLANQTPVTPTRHHGLGYAQIDRETWQFVETLDGPPSQVGVHYRRKAELLADVDRFATDYGLELR